MLVILDVNRGTSKDRNFPRTRFEVSPSSMLVQEACLLFLRYIEIYAQSGFKVLFPSEGHAIPQES